MNSGHELGGPSRIGVVATAGSRCKQLEVIHDEIEAVHHAMSRANYGDLVVVCVDQHPLVMSELENWSPHA